MRAWAFPSGLPDGGGNLETMASIKSSIPSPVFALTRTASSGSSPRSCSICFFTEGISADGRSILFITGTIVKSCSIAIKRLDIV